MGAKFLFVTLIAAFVFVFFSDGLIHGVVLRPDYEASQSLWRSDAEMQSRFGWMMLGQLMVAVGMVVIGGAVLSPGVSRLRACWYFAGSALLGNGYIPIFFAVMPLPSVLCWKWLGFGVVQVTVVAAIVIGSAKYFVPRVTE